MSVIAFPAVRSIFFVALRPKKDTASIRAKKLTILIFVDVVKITQFLSVYYIFSVVGKCI
jgi:hypothetical protein